MVDQSPTQDGLLSQKQSSARLARLERENAQLKKFAMEVDEIRNSIIGTQTVNWSAHIYPLVAALQEIGYVGESYEEARAKASSQIDRIQLFREALETALIYLLPPSSQIKLAVQTIQHALK